MEKTSAPMKTMPNARRVFGAHTPFGGSLPGLLGFGGVGRSAYCRLDCEIGGKGRAGRVLSLEKPRSDGLIVDILVQGELRRSSR